MPKQSSTARVKAWRENLQRKAALFDQVDAERRSRLKLESLSCVGDVHEIAAVLGALLENPRCFRFPREIDALGCLWRFPASCLGYDQEVAKRALEAFRAAAVLETATSQA